MKSIRYKVLIYMTVNILLFAVLLYGANILFAEKYYIQYKKDMLSDTAKKLSQLIKDDTTKDDYKDDNLILEINKIEKSIGGAVTIGTTGGIQYYPDTRADDLSGKHGSNSFVSFSDVGKKHAKVFDKKMQKDHPFFLIVEDPRLKINTLRYQTQLDNGLIMQVWVPMEGISESAAISNHFTMFIGILAILFSGIWSLYISERITKPITRIKNIAKKMSQLDFSEKIEIKGKDEVAQLSHIINSLSFELSNAINKLNIKNLQLENDIRNERELDRMRREFVSSVSHELKTPIFLIQGYADGLKANVADDENKRNFYCDVIMEEADRMDVIVKDLLDLSQIQSGMFSVNMCEFEITKLITEVVCKLGSIIEKKDIKIEINDEKDLFVIADPIRIEQVIVNYLNNAVNHVDDERKINIRVSRNETKAKISVYNSGQQVPSESLNKIWTSFYKVDQSRTRDYGGSGLGLSIVRAIMEAHHNLYGVNNSVDGVEFWFEVDIRK